MYYLFLNVVDIDSLRQQKGHIWCICRNKNRNDTDSEPHFAGGKPHQFQIRDYPFFTFSIKVHSVMQIIEVALTRWRIQIAPPTVLSASGAMFMIYSLVLL